MNWISIKERLPEEDTQVIVYSEKFNTPTIAAMVLMKSWITDTEFEYVFRELVDGCCGDRSHAHELDEVTHWIPLPKGPDEVD